MKKTLWTLALCAVAYAALPPEIEADRLLTLAKKQVDANNHAAAVASFDKVFALGIKLPPKMEYIYAKSLAAAGRDSAALVHVGIYLEKMGRNGEKYAEALQLYTECEEKLTLPGMVSIPAGCFYMGSNEGENDEKPTHRVCLSAYKIDAHEVTQGEYQKVTGSNPSHFASCGATCPVENVDWSSASGYCASVGKRLPTEAEWEYAARGAGQSAGHIYSGSGSADVVAWSSSNSGSKTHPVCTKQKNEIGLCDMSGNVWEWVSDWYDSEYYSKSPSQDPQGASSGSLRVLRGGSWYCGPQRLRSADRSNDSPDLRSNGLGFRCVLAGR